MYVTLRREGFRLNHKNFTNLLRVRFAAAEQDAEAPGEGEAALGPDGGQAAE